MSRSKLIYVLFGIIFSLTSCSLSRRSLASRGAHFANDLSNSPPSFIINHKRYVPIDILKNDVKWSVSKDLSSVSAQAIFDFVVGEKGFPFLLLNPNSTAELNGKEIELEKLSYEPFKKSNYYALLTPASPGKRYKVKVKYSFSTDKKETHFLPLKYYLNSFVEKGIPSNGQQDHFPLRLGIKIDGITRANQSKVKVIANGKTRFSQNGHFQIVFPKRLTSASFFIDISYKRELIVKSGRLKSVDGRVIPLFVYSTKDDDGKKWVTTFFGALNYAFHNLESKFGPYPYEKIIFKSSQKDGGGAFAGAMVLPKRFIELVTHELGHSWFSHSIGPVSGNDLWIYEGLGQWAPLYRTGVSRLDRNYKKSLDLTKNIYDLWKPDWKPYDAHVGGEAILASIDKTIRTEEGPFMDTGLVGVLKEIHKRRAGTTMSTDDFEKLLTEYTQIDFKPIFNFYFVDYPRNK